MDRLIEFMLKPKAMSEKDLAAAVRRHRVHAWLQGTATAWHGVAWQGPDRPSRAAMPRPALHVA